MPHSSNVNDPVGQFNRNVLKVLGLPDDLKCRKVVLTCEIDNPPKIELELIEYEKKELDGLAGAVASLKSDRPVVKVCE